MTEQEYIDATDLAKIRIAFTALRDVLPSNSSIVDAKEHRAVMHILHGWTEELYNKIKIKK